MHLNLLRAFACLCLLVSAPLASRAAEPAKGMVVLTIAGAIAESNRGPVGDFEDGFFRYQERSFDRALELDRETLEALPQREITARATNWTRPYRLKGPLVADVLKLAGADGRAATFYALDGYGSAFTPEELAAHDWVLALSADGKLLGLGGLGPLWMAYDVPGEPTLTDGEAKWPWAVFYVEVE